MGDVEHLFMCLLAVTPVFLPGEPRGQRGLVAAVRGVGNESATIQCEDQEPQNRASRIC